MCPAANKNEELEAFSKQADDAFEQVLKTVVTASHESAKDDKVARAILFFLVRVASSWRSIRTLKENSQGKSAETIVVDCGTLLRAMFDAYLQATFVVSDRELAATRASDYFDFEQVERHKRLERVSKHDNMLTRHLKGSPKFADGEAQSKEAFDKVKSRFLVKGKKASKIRDKWYTGSLFDIARSLGKDDEYDTLLATFNGCVHSSACDLKDGGGPLSPKNVIEWASTVAARVAQLSVDHNKITLAESDAAILAEWAKPYFALENPPEK